MEPPHGPPFTSRLLFSKITAQPTNRALLTAHYALIKYIFQKSAGPGCKRCVSTNCQIKRSDRMICPTFSRISSKLPQSMFGSNPVAPWGVQNPWHPKLDMWRKTKTRLIRWIFTVYHQHHVASPHVATGRIKRGWPFCNWKRKLSI